MVSCETVQIKPPSRNPIKDKMIACVQCETPFVFTAAEQKRFLNLGFGIPKRCAECRKKKFKAIRISERRKHNGNKRQGWRKDRELEGM
ncbi:MAG: zinc-ribbon domain containing protein [Deltaproteobacteria bacterium]|nr:MAG: zinc-ribbon domain containing protein [Deltaproteobacteria bacterium]